MNQKTTIKRFVVKHDLDRAIIQYCKKNNQQQSDVTRRLWADLLERPELAEGYKEGRPRLPENE